MMWRRILDLAVPGWRRDGSARKIRGMAYALTILQNPEIEYVHCEELCGRRTQGREPADY